MDVLNPGLLGSAFRELAVPIEKLLDKDRRSTCDG
jgi:hypothetical protein